MPHIKAKGSASLFQNRTLEMLTRTHPGLILGIYIPLCAWMLYYFYVNIAPSFLTLAFVCLIGFFSWTFFEYILHRYVFHFINEQEWSRKFHYFVHGVHHEYPKDRQRLVMPPVPSLVMAALFFIFFRSLLGGYGYAFFSGFIIGYLAYAMMHYCMHAFRPPKNFLRFLWEYHNTHHFRHPDKAFGVSSPFWDWVFGTRPPKEQKPRRPVEAGR